MTSQMLATAQPLRDPMSEPILTLEQRIPEAGFSDEEEAMEAFLDWVADRGIEPYPAQEEAILELFSDSHVILKTPTGSGTTRLTTWASPVSTTRPPWASATRP